VVDNNISLENILFYATTDTFRPESYPALEVLLETMRKYPTLKIEIQGHICCRNNLIEDYNAAGQPVSASRAKAVYNYLIEGGIDPARMTHTSFGSTRKRFPLEQNEYEMTMNRRVEIVILEK
jgi:outer membrane protein OmpA-like peptidoglycan-associated protein